MIKRLHLKYPDVSFNWNKNSLWGKSPIAGFWSFYLGRFSIDCWFWKPKEA
jgi:hypothetical protein